jgi:hypothetical protein
MAAVETENKVEKAKDLYIWREIRVWKQTWKNVPVESKWSVPYVQ